MKKNIIAIVASALALASCNYLDMTPTDRTSGKTMWSSTKNAEYAINYIYTYLWDLNSNPTVLGLTESLTDEMKYTSCNYNAMAYIPSEMAYGGQVITPTYIDAYMGYWGTLYEAIRRTNENIDYLHQYGQMSGEDKERLEGELRFMRGFLYFELVKRYKEVILYDEDLSKISKNAEISSEKDCWDFVEADFDYAAEHLPAASESNGRLNKGMAYAYLTRAMLYAKRYEAVILAADEVAKLGYDLEGSYKDACTKTLAEGNRETILQYTFDITNDNVHTFNFYYTPGGDFVVNDSKGGGYAVPTQEMVESYELAKGGFPNWAPWHTSSGTTAEPPYQSLEPRFQATILFNGSPWKDRIIEPYVGGTDGWAKWKTEKEPKGKTVTGYYLRKLVDESYDVNTTGSSQPFILMRYAEVLLNKAEALYFTGDEAGANDMIRKIRTRVALPYKNLGGNNLWDQIRQERKVELAFEGQHYWDLRRWELSAEDYPKGLCNYQQHGLKIEKEGDHFVYSYVSVDERDRTYSKSLYRFPMPESELKSNPKVNQYPEWK